MDDGVWVHEGYRDGDVWHQVYNAVFGDLEITLVKILKHIAAFEVLEHNVHALWVLEEVDQLADVGVLADFQNFDLVPEHHELAGVNLPFLDDFDCVG